MTTDSSIHADLALVERHAAADSTAWTGIDLDDNSSFVLNLDNEAVAAIESALKAFKALELEGDDVDRNNFPVGPNLERLFERAAHEIHRGKGFCIIRGLDMSRYTVEESLIIFLACGGFIGDVRGIQDKKRNMFSHITDSRNWKNVPASLRHGIHTSSGLPFHTDMGADILALQVRQAVKKGGHTYLASASKIVSELIESDPEAVQTVLQPNWPIQVSGKPARHVLAPLVTYHDGHIMASLDPGRLGLHPAAALTLPRRRPGDDAAAPEEEAAAIPRLTQAQERALTALSAAAAKHQLRLEAETGDMVFVNNWALLHARDPYGDFAPVAPPAPPAAPVDSVSYFASENGGPDDEEEPQRHLVRLWLRNRALAWDVPQNMKVPWEAAYGPAGDGHRAYVGGDIQLLYPVVPMPEYKVPRYSAGSAAFVLEDSDEE